MGFKYMVESDVDHFEFWSGAKQRMDDATDEQRELVEERIEELCESGDDVDETAINDLVWFGCDDIFFPDEEE